MCSICVTSFPNLFILPPINVCQMLMQTRNSIHVSHRANMREETAFTVQCVIERRRSLLHVGRVSSYELNKPPALSIPAHIQGFVWVCAMCMVYGYHHGNIWHLEWLTWSLCHVWTISSVKSRWEGKKEQIKGCKMTEW